MSQNQLITILAIVLLVVILGSVAVLWNSPLNSNPALAPTESEAPSAHQNQFSLDVVKQQAYQLLNKQLVKEGALPVQPAAQTGKANPFL